MRIEEGFFAIRNGPRVLNLLEEAIALDSNNQAVYNAKGKAYLEAPRIGGGSPDKALEFLLIALNDFNESNHRDDFVTYYFFSRGISRKG